MCTPTPQSMQASIHARTSSFRGATVSHSCSAQGKAPVRSPSLAPTPRRGRGVDSTVLYCTPASLACPSTPELIQSRWRVVFPSLCKVTNEQPNHVLSRSRRGAVGPAREAIVWRPTSARVWYTTLSSTFTPILHTLPIYLSTHAPYHTRLYAPIEPHSHQRHTI